MDYGQRNRSSSGETGTVLPGSPDARAKAYMRDMYDDMPPLTPKNKSASGEPNTGIQGSASTKTGDKSAKAGGKSGQYKKAYGGPAGSPVK